MSEPTLIPILSESSLDTLIDREIDQGYSYLLTGPRYRHGHRDYVCVAAFRGTVSIITVKINVGGMSDS